jgi:hypothetical protein
MSFAVFVRTNTLVAPNSYFPLTVKESYTNNGSFINLGNVGTTGLKISLRLSTPGSVFGLLDSGNALPIDFTDKLHHVGVTVNNGFTKFYLDGSVIASGNLSNGITANVTNTQIQFIGYEGSRWFNGQMQDMRMYNRTLTDTEMQTLATRQSVDDTGLMINMPMNDGTGVVPQDYSGNSLSITTGGFGVGWIVAGLSRKIGKTVTYGATLNSSIVLGQTLFRLLTVSGTVAVTISRRWTKSLIMSATTNIIVTLAKIFTRTGVVGYLGQSSKDAVLRQDDKSISIIEQRRLD